MTVREAYEQGTKSLVQSKIEEAKLDAWYLLEFVTGMSRAVYFADADREMTAEWEALYLELIQKRSERIPLQHLTGVQEFMGLEFQVNEHVLIPRQDTEVLVETALDFLKRRGEMDVEILDLCTGSGCILLSILFHTRQERCKGKVSGVGADISPEALAVARENGVQLGIDAAWKQGDLFEALGTAEEDEAETHRFDLIVSNPPYIRSDVIESLQPEVRDHDPYLALDGKEDGLFFYRRIIEESPSYLKDGGWLMFEIGSDQGSSVSGLMQKAGFQSVSVKKDLAGLDRVVSGMYDKCEGFEIERKEAFTIERKE